MRGLGLGLGLEITDATPAVVPPHSGNDLLLEDNSSFLLMEDNTSTILLEV